MKFIFSLLVISFMTNFAEASLLKIASSVKAHASCSAEFFQDRKRKNIETELRYMHTLLPSLPIYINKRENYVRVAFFKKAKYFSGLGCVIEHQKKMKNLQFPELIKIKQNAPNSLSTIARSDFESIINPFVNEDDPTKTNGHTRALIIKHKDKVLYEKYFRSFTQQTPQIGWSLTKSFTATMVGIAVKQNLLNLEETNLLPNWEKDLRADISTSDLLKMRSSLEWKEDYADLTSNAIQMLFAQGDTGSFASQSQMTENKAPGDVYTYSTGTSVLLQYILKRKISNLKDYLNFPRKYLFQPLGITNAEFTVDETGTYQGGSFLFMNARDWLKLGELYLNKGQWEGQQIIDPSWVKFVTTTYTSKKDEKGQPFSYGAHFKTNAGFLSWKDLPEDTYAAVGHQGQFIMVIPSQDLIITRLGLTVSPSEFDINSLARDIIKALDSL